MAKTVIVQGRAVEKSFALERQCKGKHRTTGQPCQRWAMKGRDFCSRHGGKSISGLAHPKFTNGEYMKYLPKRYHATFEQSMDDPNLLSLQRSIGVSDARLQELFALLETGEAGDVWASLVKAKAAFVAAQDQADTVAMQRAMMTAWSLIDRGAGHFAVWADIRETQEHRRKLVDTERKLIREMKVSISAEQAINLIGAVIATVRRHVTDRAVLQAISADIAVLMTRPGQTAAPVDDADDAE